MVDVNDLTKIRSSGLRLENQTHPCKGGMVRVKERGKHEGGEGRKPDRDIKSSVKRAFGRGAA